MADRYGDRDSGRYGGREYGRHGGREEEEDDRLGRYRQGLDYRGPYDVISRRPRGGPAPGRDYGDEAYGGRDYGNDYGSDSGREYGRDYGRGYARGPGRDEETDEARYRRERYYGGGFGARGYDDRDNRDYGRDYERGYGRDYGRGEPRVYGRGYDYEEEDERDYRRDEEERVRERGRGAQTDYGRTSSRFFGRGGGEYEARHARGYDDDDDERGYERGERGRGYEYEEDERGGGRGGRGWLDRVSDEVASWFGDRAAVRRRRLDDKSARRRGRGPKGYRRSDERIREDINDRLSDQDWLDASEIEVGVSGGEVTLAGTVETRYDKRLAEDIAESVSGVTQVQNNLRVVYRQDVTTRTDETTVVAARPAATAGASNDPTFDTTTTRTAYDATADTMPGATSGAVADVNPGAVSDAVNDMTTDANDAGGASSSGAASGRR